MKSIFKITITVSVDKELYITTTEMPVEKETKESYTVRYSNVKRVINKKSINNVVDSIEGVSVVSIMGFAEKEQIKTLTEYMTVLIGDHIESVKKQTEIMINNYNIGIKKNNLLQK